MKGEHKNTYATITEHIVSAIERGVGTFQMPWHTVGHTGLPVNARTGATYQGVNIACLWAAQELKGFDSNVWASYRQWGELGAQVQRGAKGTPVCFFKELSGKAHVEADEAEGEEDKRRVVARTSWVFNSNQVDGYKPKEVEVPKLSESERLVAAESFLFGLGADTRHGGNRAFYNVSEDFIQLPPYEAFKSAVGYVSTLSHELTHWTGAKSRLNRDFESRFQSKAVAAEELVAELGAAFLLARLGLSSEPRPDHAQYIAGWVSLLRDDNRAIFTAAAKAGQACDFLYEVHAQREEQAASQQPQGCKNCHSTCGVPGCQVCQGLTLCSQCQTESEQISADDREKERTHKPQAEALTAEASMKAEGVLAALGTWSLVGTVVRKFKVNEERPAPAAADGASSPEEAVSPSRAPSATERKELCKVSFDRFEAKVFKEADHYSAHVHVHPRPGDSPYYQWYSGTVSANELDEMAKVKEEALTHYTEVQIVEGNYHALHDWPHFHSKEDLEGFRDVCRMTAALTRHLEAGNPLETFELFEERALVPSDATNGVAENHHRPPVFESEGLTKLKDREADETPRPNTYGSDNPGTPAREPGISEKWRETMAAWRPYRQFIEGILDNTEPGHVRGWISFVGMKEPVTLDLKGDFHRDIRGTQIHFKNPSPEEFAEWMKVYVEGFPKHQTGTVGDITAGLPPQDYVDYPYLEYYSDQIGRVVLELEPNQVEVLGTPLKWENEEPVSREQQAKSMGRFLGELATSLGAQTMVVEHPGHQGGNPVQAPGTVNASNSTSNDEKVRVAEGPWPATQTEPKREPAGAPQAKAAPQEARGSINDDEETYEFLAGVEYEIDGGRVRRVFVTPIHQRPTERPADYPEAAAPQLISGDTKESDPMTEKQTEKNGPLYDLRSGRVQGGIWDREGLNGETSYTFSVGRSYKDKDGNWQRTSSYDPQDLPHVQAVLDRARAIFTEELGQDITQDVKVTRKEEAKQGQKQTL